MALLGGRLSLIRVDLALLGWMNDSLETEGTASRGELGGSGWSLFASCDLFFV